MSIGNRIDAVVVFLIDTNELSAEFAKGRVGLIHSEEADEDAGIIRSVGLREGRWAGPCADHALPIEVRSSSAREQCHDWAAEEPTTKRPNRSIGR